MPESDYSLATMTVVQFDAFVRKRPAMYFGVGRQDPRLATRVLCAVVGHAFHPATRIAASHTPHVLAEITADLAFSVADDQADLLTGQGVPKLGYYDSLLTTDRLSSAAAAAVSAQTVVEVWRDGRAFRQTLIGLQPVAPPAEFPAPADAGTRVAYVLDAGYFGSAAITTHLASLDVHGPHCTSTTASGTVVIRDHRDRSRPNEYRCA
ncbi:hypothetical protein DRA43_06880 [Micromonospora provocatoris]|nr:hypothetical protein [Micromonospora provocatoris]RBJ08187.1 hypothetical protein DRA43_06880 [Micromonospora provocatoris]